ncbi:hypothetical protein H4S01_001217 [Coemansia sp. RSA 2610]|nr:hypothetical protein H4S01_001217 [Coemansia sp. RSA 2610]
MARNKKQQQQQQRPPPVAAGKPPTPPKQPTVDKRDPLTMSADEVSARLEKLRKRARFLDACMYVPCTCHKVKFGVESMLGLVPIVGDFAGLILAFLFVSMICGKFHTPASIKTQMVLNIAIDFTVGLVPILGDIFDIAFKANLRNMALIERHVERQRRSTQAAEMGTAAPGVKAPASAYIPRIPIKKGATGRVLERAAA